MYKCFWLSLLTLAPICGQELTGRPSFRLPNYDISAKIEAEGSFELQRSGPGLTNWTGMTNFNALPGTNNFSDSITNQQRFYRMVRFTNAPVITSLPAGTTNFFNQEVRLEAAVTGSWPLRLQWYKDTVRVDGATNATLVFPGRANLSGGYNLVASNSWGVDLTPTVQVKTVNPVATTILGKKIQYVIKGAQGGFISNGSFETTYGNSVYNTTSANFNLNDAGQWQYGVLTENVGRAILTGGFVYQNGAVVDMAFTNLTEGTYYLQVPNVNGWQFGEFKVTN